MKNVYDVLQEKEAEIQRLKEELRALSIVAPLLEEESEGELEEDLAPETRVTPVDLSPDLSHRPSDQPADSAPVASIWPWSRRKKAASRKAA